MFCGGFGFFSSWSSENHLWERLDEVFGWKNRLNKYLSSCSYIVFTSSKSPHCWTLDSLGRAEQAHGLSWSLYKFHLDIYLSQLSFHDAWITSFIIMATVSKISILPICKPSVSLTTVKGCRLAPHFVRPHCLFCTSCWPRNSTDHSIFRLMACRDPRVTQQSPKGSFLPTQNDSISYHGSLPLRIFLLNVHWFPFHALP